PPILPPIVAGHTVRPAREAVGVLRVSRLTRIRCGVRTSIRARRAKPAVKALSPATLTPDLEKSYAGDARARSALSAQGGSEDRRAKRRARGSGGPYRHRSQADVPSKL